MVSVYGDGQTAWVARAAGRNQNIETNKTID